MILDTLKLLNFSLNLKKKKSKSMQYSCVTDETAALSNINLYLMNAQVLFINFYAVTTTVVNVVRL